MDLGGALVVQGAVEEAEVLNDRVQEIPCKCGHVLKVAVGVTLNGKMTIAASETKTTSCPRCGEPVNI